MHGSVNFKYFLMSEEIRAPT